MNFKWGGTLVACAGLALTACKDSRSTVSSDVISAFQSSCVTNGRWTQAALQHSANLVSVLETLKSDKACSNYVSTLNTIQSLSSQISAIAQNQTYSDYRISEETFQDLTLALQDMKTNPDAAASMLPYVISAQVDLAQKRAASDQADSQADRNRYVNSTQQLATLMQGVLGSMNSGLGSCLQQSPAASVELATNVVAIGGSFFSPIVGAGAQMLGELVNTAVEYVRTAAPESAIYDLYANEMPVALGCGLESMSELYCEENDAFSLLQIQAQGYPQPGQQPLPLWEGMDLLDRKFPILNTWLQSVKNGVLPTDQVEADRQNTIWKKLHGLDDYFRTIYADFKDGQKIYDATTDASQKQDILVKTLADVAHTLAPPRDDGSSGPNPFADKSSDSADFACWLVWGPTTADCKKTDPEHPYGYDDIKEYIRKVLLGAMPTADFNLLNKNWSDLLDIVDKLITLEFSQTITADPQALLAAARQGVTPDQSPREVLLYINTFLQHMLDEDDHTNPQLPGLIQDTMTMISDVIKILDDTSCTDEHGNPIDCQTKRLKQIGDIFDKFQLRISLQFFIDRINNFVEWDLEYKLRHGQIPQDVQDVLISAGIDIRDRLSAAGQLQNVTPLVQDLDQGRKLIQGNIEVFRSFFTKSLGRAVQDLHDAAVRAGEPAEGADRPNGQTLGQLCTLVLATGQDWPADVSWDICSKAVLNSIYPDPKGQLTIHLDKLKQDLDGKPLEYRICAFHRFLRAGRLAEVVSPQRENSEALMIGAFGSF
jgi:hypothetical protein